MNKGIKVSIVVPCYNVEKYIKECVDTIINQTLKDIEIICVDDGSKDGTLDILKEYAEIDKRVVIITKPNSGYGNSMNRGFDAARGEYIGIIESDDYVELNMLECLYNEAKRLDADAVKSNFYRFTGDGEGDKTVFYRLTENSKNYGKIIDPSKNFDIFNYEMMNWTGIYKKSFIEKNKIRHNETPGASYQDNGFWFQVFTSTHKLSFLDKAFYHYRCDNPNSSINNKAKIYCMCEEYAFIRKILEDKGIFKQFAPIYFYKKYHNYMYTYHRVAPEFKLEFIERFATEFNADKDNGTVNFFCFPPSDLTFIKDIMKNPQALHQKYQKDLEKERKIAAKRKRKKPNIFSKIFRKIKNFFWHWKHYGFKATMAKVKGKLKKK